MNRLKNLTELFDNIEKTLRNLKESDKVCILHHDDADGCCSTAMLSIIIYRLTGKYPEDFIPSRPREYHVNELKHANPNYVFVLDVPLSPEELPIFDGFVLDHHIAENQKSRKGMPYLNPRSFTKKDENVPPTSYMVYRILKRMFPDEKASWIAAIGITEDHRVELCRDVFEDVKKEYQDLLKSEITQFELEKSVFGELWDMVRSGKMTRDSEGAETAVLALIECKDRPDKFLNGLTQHSGVLKRFYDKIMYQIEDSMRDVERRAEFHSDKKMMFYETKRTTISGSTSFISDKLRQRYPNWIVCVIHRNVANEEVKASIRLEQTKVDADLVAILNKIKGKIPSVEGGGHRSAIGAEMSVDDLERFKEEFLAAL